MTQQWPAYDESLNFASDEENFTKIVELIKAVRGVRAEMNVHPTKRASLILETSDKAAFEMGGQYLAKFAFATDVTITEKYEGSTDGMVQVVTNAARGFIPMMELIDPRKRGGTFKQGKSCCRKRNCYV